ncbi:MAG: efflux RND transporter periplasmic adaptor subunit [Victivallaceae bacterium]|nr:efflux RND transporter periplasmic adaptor subunit [Victivallaceae bacterium]
MMKQLFALGLAAVLSSAFATEGEHQHPSPTPTKATESVWTCSMHPQIRMPRPGKCPICHMDLIPLKSDAAGRHSAVPMLTLSPYAEKLAEVRTAKVERKFVPAELFLNGRIDYDESSIADIALRFPGRIDKLYINYTGVRVHQGEHMAKVFSPDLAVMQTEYLLEIRKSDQESLRESVRNKILSWGFTPEQIAEIEKRGVVVSQLTINAPIDGTVIEKNVVEGQYFDKETRLFRIADLSRLWLILDVYEMDLPLIHYGQEVEFRTDATPGETLRGVISYVGPVLDPKTRTVPVRINLANPDGRLKPGMFARATVRAVLDEHGKIIDDRLAGKWISPMHPEIIRDQPGKCPVCGMDLVPAESLGFSTTPSAKAHPPLVIPATAPLLTGKRAVVYVRTAPGKYEGRTVELGPRTGDFYPVRSGLAGGEEVVTSGTMKIDSAMQIAGLPSMTSPENFAAQPMKMDMPKTASLDDVFRAVLAVHAPLVKGDAGAAATKLAAVRKAVEALPADAKRQELLATLPETLPADIGGLRAVYGKLAEVLYRRSEEPGFDKQALKLHRFHCPMALGGKGGYWFQDSAKLENPYFGAAMLQCGEEK